MKQKAKPDYAAKGPTKISLVLYQFLQCSLVLNLTPIHRCIQPMQSAELDAALQRIDALELTPIRTDRCFYVTRLAAIPVLRIFRCVKMPYQ